MRVGQGLCDYIKKAYCFRFKTKEVIMKKQSTPVQGFQTLLTQVFLLSFLFFLASFFFP